MNQVVVQGYQGGKLIVNDCAHVIAFFSQRYETGGPCQVTLGPVLDELLAMKSGEHLQQKIEGIDDICVCEASERLQPNFPEPTLYILSSCWHTIDMIVVSQDKLRQAAEWACIAVRRKAASD
jgi:hypothetical protein